MGLIDQEPTRDISGGHYVKFFIDGYGSVTTTFECREPDTKPCHQIYDDGVPTTRVRTCNFVEWMEATGEGFDAYRGEERELTGGPISIWGLPNEQGWVWTYPGDEPEID